MYFYTRGYFQGKIDNSEKEHKYKPCLSWPLKEEKKKAFLSNTESLKYHLMMPKQN